MKTNIYVLYGGKSVEHEVSLKTAAFVMNALDKDKYNVHQVYITKDGVWCNLGVLRENIEDVNQLTKSYQNTVSSSIGEFLIKDLKAKERNVMFPVLHGKNGEDGTIQGFLELLNIPYVGNGVLGSAVGIDKVVMKDLFTKANIPQVNYTSFTSWDWNNHQQKVYTEIERTIDYPCFVKPAKLGSSVGINRCENREELQKAIKEAFLYDSKLVIEEEVIGREMQIAVIGNDHPKASVVGEFIQERHFMDYNAKYVDGKLIAVIPAELSPETSDKMRQIATEAFRVLNCCGLVRVDYFVTEDNSFFVNEVNTMPGFTKLSMFPALWKKTDGTTHSQLMDKFIELALDRHENEKSLLNTRWTK